MLVYVLNKDGKPLRPYISVSVAGGKGIWDGTYGIEIQSADEPVKEKAEEYKELNATYVEQSEFVGALRTGRKKLIRLLKEQAEPNRDYPEIRRAIREAGEEYCKARIEGFRLYLRLRRAKNFLKL